MSSPQIQLETLFRFDDAGRIVSTREPGLNPCPTFALIRDAASCVWGIRHDVPEAIADELNHLAQQEPPITDLRSEPVNAVRYRSLLGGHIFSGPAFTFPLELERASNMVQIERIEQLKLNFRGWTQEEVEERSPIIAVLANGHAISICFCARRSPVAAEAGLETAEAFRGRGFGPQVTAAWGLAVRTGGRTPLYSTSWTNTASLRVARKLNLMMYATDWNLSDDH